MSRTYRNHPRCFRNPSTFPIIRDEIAAMEALKDAGFDGHNRLRKRSHTSGDIPSAYDDIAYDTRERSKPVKK